MYYTLFLLSLFFFSIFYCTLFYYINSVFISYYPHTFTLFYHYLQFFSIFLRCLLLHSDPLYSLLLRFISFVLTRVPLLSHLSLFFSSFHPISIYSYLFISSNYNDVQSSVYFSLFLFFTFLPVPVSFLPFYAAIPSFLMAVSFDEK